MQLFDKAVLQNQGLSVINVIVFKKNLKFKMPKYTVSVLQMK